MNKITIMDINKITQYSNIKCNQRNINEKQCRKGLRTFMEAYIKNWKIGDEDYCFQNLTNTLEEYTTKVNPSESNRIISFFVNEGLPMAKNFKTCKKIIEQSNIPSKENVLEACDKYIICRRIKNNHETLTNRFNDIDKFVKEYRINEDNIQDCIYEMCNNINKTRTASIDTKYNVCLENILYSFQKNNIKVKPETVLETVTDYFLSNQSSEKELSLISKVLKENRLYNCTEKNSLSYVTEYSAKINKEDNFLLEGVAFNRQTVKDIFNNFKLEPIKSPEIINKFIVKMYILDAKQVIDETPNFLAWFRKFLVFGTLGINLYLGCITYLVDKFIELHMQRKDTEKMISKFKSEKEKAESKLSKLSKDEADRCNKYIKELEKNIDTLEIYKDSLYSDKELAEMNADKDDFDFKLESFMYGEPEGEFDDEMKLDLAYVLTASLSVEEFFDSDFDEIMSIVDEEIDRLESGDLEELSSFANKNSEIIPPEQLSNIFSNYKQELNTQENKTPETYLKSSILQEGIYNLSNRKKNMDIKKNKKESILEIYKAAQLSKLLHDFKNGDIVTESSFGTTLKMAGQRLKKSALKLSDKEKIWSKQLDNSIDKMYQKVEKELTNKNREAVIKGSIIPSFSSAIKIVLASGAAGALINPVLSIIGVVGGLAVSKAATKKEKQFILDEIEIQLRLVDKKIQLAESNNDMKSLEQLMKIQQKLEREKRRIRYNMRNYYPITKND